MDLLTENVRDYHMRCDCGSDSCEAYAKQLRRFNDLVYCQATSDTDKQYKVRGKKIVKHLQEATEKALESGVSEGAILSWTKKLKALYDGYEKATHC